MDLCSDCHCKPGWHQLWCPRAQRVMTAMVRRLRADEAEQQ
jgi:hypothetical protein